MDDGKMHIHTIQSYLVLETEKFYQKIVADCGISHFYSFKSDNEKIIPFLEDGCSNILFEYSKNNMKSYFLGNSDKLQTLKLKKNCDYFGIRFQPGANPFFYNQEVKDLVDQKINLTDFNIMENLTDKMAEQETFTNRMCTFMAEYRNWLNNTSNGKKQLFFQMVILIVQKNGLLKISELIDITGYSSRYINLLFETNLGCSAKQFCKNVKMHTLINELNRKQVDSLLDFSSKFNFYDQSHFIHSFKEFTGVSPKEYIDRVKKASYCSKVLNQEE